jgi:hypothetical protein
VTPKKKRFLEEMEKEKKESENEGQKRMKIMKRTLSAASKIKKE